MTVYATKVTQAYLARRAAQAAGGAAINFILGTVVVGDGNGAVPLVSDLLALNGGAGGVTHEVWRGKVVQTVLVNGITPSEIDVKIVIPSTTNDGTEIGPFWLREFLITDENGVPMVVGTTQLEKSTGTANGQTSDLSWTAAIGESNSSTVVLTPPAAGYATQVDIYSIVNDRTPLAAEPLYRTDSAADGHNKSTFHVRTAAQPPSDTTADVGNPAELGVGRPATDAEFAAGVPDPGSLTLWPWPTIQQIRNFVVSFFIGSGEGVSIRPNSNNVKTANLDFPDLAEEDTLAPADLIAFYSLGDQHHRKTTIGNLLSMVGGFPGALFPIYYDGVQKKYGVNAATGTTAGVGRTASPQETAVRTTNQSLPGPAWVRPEDLPVIPTLPTLPTVPNPFPIGTQLRAARNLSAEQIAVGQFGAGYPQIAPAVGTPLPQQVGVPFGASTTLPVSEGYNPGAGAAMYGGAVPGEVNNVVAAAALATPGQALGDGRLAAIDFTCQQTQGDGSLTNVTYREAFAVAGTTWAGGELKIATISAGIVQFNNENVATASTGALSFITLPGTWFFNGATYTRVS